jgi:NADH:ubiquinone oxidoreductase subunit B-like Fe-S oxidoreductase/NADH:ubiquinone oxidoreductase subunit 3 (subunit A)
VAAYIPLFILFALAALIVVGMFTATSLLGPKNPTPEKMIPFECGSETTGGRNVRPSVKFYLTAILFVVFDIEAVLIYPWVVQFRSLGWWGSRPWCRSSRCSSWRSSTCGRRERSNGRSEGLRRQRAGLRHDEARRLLNWAKKYSLFQYPFVTACCAMEFMAFASPRFDMSRFGAEAPRFSPRQSDLLWVVGTISQRQAPVLRRIYEQMADPKYVLAFGTCASCGGFYDNYTTRRRHRQNHPRRHLRPGLPALAPRPSSTASCCCKTRSRAATARPAS